MACIFHGNQRDHKKDGIREVTPSKRLKKHTYVLPSGRVLRVVVYDEREIVGSTA